MTHDLLVDEVLRLRKEKAVLECNLKKQEVKAQRAVEANFRLVMKFEETTQKFWTERQQREDTYSRLVAVQHEYEQYMETVTKPDLTAMDLVKTGTIDGKECEIRGVVTRRGGGKGKSNNGPCKLCVRMLDCKTTEKMLLVGVNCNYIGNPGHIVKLPQEVQEVVGSEEWLAKMNALTLAKYPQKRRQSKRVLDAKLLNFDAFVKH